MEPIWKGKQTNKTSNTCAGNKGKQTNKQTSRGGTCGGADAGGDAELRNMWSPICNASEYTEELWRCIGDALEKCGVRYAGSYSDITPPQNPPPPADSDNQHWEMEVWMARGCFQPLPIVLTQSQVL